MSAVTEIMTAAVIFWIRPPPQFGTDDFTSCITEEDSICEYVKHTPVHTNPNQCTVDER